MIDFSKYNLYAHSENDGANNHVNGVKESFLDHVLAVAKRAGIFAADFDAKEEAEIAGLFHDVGKLPPVFGERLAGKHILLDHSSPGCAALLLHYKNILAVGSALCCHAHHIGLKKGTSDFLRQEVNRSQNPIFQAKNLENNGIIVTTTDTQYLTDGLLALLNGKLPSLTKSIYSCNGSDHLQQMLNLRMLLSSLCDADVIETKAHFAGDKHEPRRLYWSWDQKDGQTVRDDSGTPLGRSTAPIEMNQEKWRDAARKLKDYFDNVVEPGADASEEVLEVRKMLLKACIEKSNDPMGIFTLSSPTGSGKTLAMLAFAILHAIKHDLKRIIVVLPYLSIIDQNAKIIRDVFKEMGFVIESHSGKKGSAGKYAWQRLESELAQNWDAPVVVTTTVQCLESMFASSPKDIKKLHNLARAVIMFDETQMIPFHIIVATMTALSHLSARFRSTVLLSTATQPAFDLLTEAIKRMGGEWKSTEIVSPTIFDMMPRRVNVSWNLTPVPWNNLAERLTSKNQVLCIVNKKAHTQELIARIRGAKDENLYHMSTDLCKKHRLLFMEKVRRHLFDNEPVTLISTQCIEAGGDIDFPCVFRALAPMFSLPQAAGRCNRHGKNKHGLGEMHVFVPELTPDETSEINAYPDDDYYFGAVLTRTKYSLNNGLDIFDPKAIRDYCASLYSLSSPENQSAHQRLKKALETRDFEGVEANYKVIKDNNINILVDYSETGDRQVYEDLVTASAYGIDNKWMAQASELIVNRGWPEAGSPLSMVIQPLMAKDRNGVLVPCADWFIYSGNYDPLLGITEKAFIKK